MKVKLLKDYKRKRGKTLKKDTVVDLFPTLAKKLIKKKAAVETDEITEEEIIIKKIMEEKDNGN